MIDETAIRGRFEALRPRLGYRRQVNRKSLEGGHHVDRNAQFEQINTQVEAFQAGGDPVISVDTKKKGLTVRCELDANTYEKGIAVSDVEMAALNIEGDAFHPEWNYTISPVPAKPRVEALISRRLLGDGAE